MSDMTSFLNNIKFDDRGLVPVIAVDDDTDQVLMMAYTNEEALQRTLLSGHATYWSRSRQKLWCKGEESGNIQKITDILLDCDGDTLIYRVKPMGIGAACHTGHRSCFYRHWDGEEWADNGEPVMFDPKEVYKFTGDNK